MLVAALSDGELRLKASTKSSHYVKRSRSVGFYGKAGKLLDCNRTHCTLALATCMLLSKRRCSNSRLRASFMSLSYSLLLTMTAAHSVWCLSQKDLVRSQLTQRPNGEEEASLIERLKHSPAINQWLVRKPLMSWLRHRTGLFVCLF